MTTTTREIVSLMPKSTGNPYFESCRLGAEEAAREVGFDLRWEGPEESSSTRQCEIVESWIREGRPSIGVSVESSSRLSPLLRRARGRGVKVVTWDADAEPDARDYTVIPASPEGIAHALVFEMARMLSGEGPFAVITSTLAAPNQNEWISLLRARVARDYPKLELVAVQPCDDQEEAARRETLQLLDARPGLKAILGICAPAVPGAASALKEADRRDVRLTGVSLPAICRRYLEEGWVDSVITWNTRHLGYLAAFACHALAGGVLAAGVTSLRAGRLGRLIVAGDEIRLGRPHIVTKGNLDKFVD